MKITLKRPHLKYQKSFQEASDELTSDSDLSAWVYLGDDAARDIPKQNFQSYVDELIKRETTPPSHFVCDSIFWAISSGEVVGRISIRHELNDFLKITREYSIINN